MSTSKQQKEATSTSAADDATPRRGEGYCATMPNLFNWANLIGFIINVVVTFGFGLWGWFDRPTNSELSAKYQTIVTPSGTAFSIWSLIFITQAIWVAMQFLVPSQRSALGVQTVGLKYLYACLAQAGWTFAFVWEVIWLSLIFMYSILFFLAWIVLEQEKLEKQWKGYFLHQFPMSIHCGWIMAASVVNTNVVLVAYGASPQAQFITACCTLAVLLLAGFYVIATTKDLTVPCVLAWALGWVYSELESPLESITDRFTASQIEGVQYAAIAGAGVLLVCVLISGVWTCCKKRQSKSSSAPASGNGRQTDEEAH
jgi:translocator protein